MAQRQVLSSPDAPQAVGPYSQGIRVGSMIFLAGQIPLDPKTGEIVPGGITEQTERVIQNIKALLSSQGLTLKNVVKATVFLQDLAEFAGMNQVYGSHFNSEPPARSTIQVARLPKDARVEIEVIAIAES